MMRIFLLLPGLLFFLASNAQQAEKNDSLHLVYLNQLIDRYVVEKNTAALDTLYAGDFKFSHGSGRYEGKAGWLTTVGRANYPLRSHDSVTVELHPLVAIVKGKMNIEKVNKTTTDHYWLKYIRVFALRQNQWKLISHITTQEAHL